MFWRTTCDLAYKTQCALVTDCRVLSWPSRPRHATCFTHSFMDCGNRSEADGTPGPFYGVRLSDQTLSMSVCLHVCSNYGEPKKDLSTEESVFIIACEGSHTSRLRRYWQQHHRVYRWLMIWLCDWEMTPTSILELRNVMYVMRTGRNSRAGAICYPNERWWRWSLADEGLDTALTAGKNITHSPIAVGGKSFDDLKHRGLCYPLKRMIEVLTTRLTFLMCLN